MSMNNEDRNLKGYVTCKTGRYFAFMADGGRSPMVTFNGELQGILFVDI